MASGTGRHHQSKARRRDSPSTKRKLEADTYDLVIIDMLMPGEGEPDASNPTTQKHCKSRVRPYREAKPVRRTEVHILDSNELAARLTDMLYLVVIMDWVSRSVLAWRLANTLGADFCVEALEDALEQYGKPEIFNTDQAASSPAPTSPAPSSEAASRSACMVRAAAWTISSSSGCGDRLCRPAPLPPPPSQFGRRGNARLRPQTHLK